jgi:hypothetical protein
MRVASDAVLERAAEIRRNGKSWLELTREATTREAGLKFFRRARSANAARKLK